MTYKVFRTRHDAQTAADQLVGWPNPAVDRVYWPEHPLATRAGNIWIVTANKDTKTQSVYLRADGSVA